MKFFLGIDPGVHGALAIYEPIAHRVRVEDLASAQVPSGRAKRYQLIPGGVARQLSWFAVYGRVHVLIEQVHAMPRQGVSSTFTFGQAFGICLGVLAGLGLPYTLVTPQEWRRELQLPRTRSKDDSRVRACQLFPEQTELFSRVKDHDRADAALIAYACALRNQEK